MHRQPRQGKCANELSAIDSTPKAGLGRHARTMQVAAGGQLG
jgi:hypothetical protein